jgi:drug/metabolite transporter (DMT)-like permease
MDFLWIFVAIFAAALQTFRSAFQKRMIPDIGKFGATYIRFIYALPFTFLIFIFWFFILKNEIPKLNNLAIFYCFIGALCQVLFTLLLMIIFSYRNFAAGIAFSKTEVLFAALIEIFILNIVFLPIINFGIILGVFAVIFLSVAKETTNINDVLVKISKSFFTFSTLFGVLTGLILAGSTVGYRMAIINVEGHILDATIYLSILAVFIQSIMMGIWLYYYKRNELRLVFKFWKKSLPAGICGSGATAGWFLAFALATAAEVRAVGQIELIFSIIISIIFFKEKVQRTETFGICMLIISILLVIYARI